MQITPIPKKETECICDPSQRERREENEGKERRERERKASTVSERDSFKRVPESTSRPGHLPFGPAGLLRQLKPHPSRHLDGNLELQREREREGYGVLHTLKTLTLKGGCL